MGKIQLNKMVFLERSEGVAFWIMMLFDMGLLTYSYMVERRINYLLLFMFIIGIIIVKSAWLMFAGDRPLNVEVEKAEHVAFWAMSLITFGLLTLEYATTGLFDHYLFYVLVTGLLTNYIIDLSFN